MDAKYISKQCGNSSVGRAQPCQGWGREFESRFPLQFLSTPNLVLITAIKFATIFIGSRADWHPPWCQPIGRTSCVQFCSRQNCRVSFPVPNSIFFLFIRYFCSSCCSVPARPDTGIGAWTIRSKWPRYTRRPYQSDM